MEDWLTRALDHATEQGIEKGIEQGIEKGIEQGMEQGIEQGMEKGMDRGMAMKFVLCVDSLMKNEGYSKERACSVLDSTVDEYEDAKRLLAEVPAGEFC